MPHDIRRTITTRWDAASVFAYLLDFSTAPEWDAGTVTCERVSGDGGVGTRYKNVSEFRGSKTELEYVVESIEGTHKFVIVGRNKTVTSTDTVTVDAAAGGGATVDYRAEMQFHGLAALASPFLSGPLQKLGDDTEKTLKQALDSRAS